MRRFAVPAQVALVALALAACATDGGGGPPEPPENTIEVETGGANAPRASVELGNGESQVFRIEVLQDAVDAGLLYIELDKDIDLEVMTSGFGTVTFSSSSKAYFGSGSSGLAAVGSVVAPAIVTLVQCRGSCVIVEPANTGVVYARVTNPGSPTTVGLYAYGDLHGDENEPGNDTLGGATTFDLMGSGAIETVGDIDFWYFDSATTVYLDVSPVGIPLEVEIVDSTGTPIPGSGGPFTGDGPIIVDAGEYLRVWALEEWQAASSQRSYYYLSDETP